jgi:DNA-binding NarL/FixJ family response regulator
MAQPSLRSEWPFGASNATMSTALRSVRPATASAPERPVPSRSTPPGLVAQHTRATVAVGIADREVLVRGGIRAALERAQGISVVADTGHESAAIEMTRRHRLGVLLVDSGMADSNGTRVVRAVRRLSPSTAVLVLASASAGAHIDRVLRTGVAGCLLKSGNPQDLVTAVRVVATGGAVLCPEITRHVLDSVARIDTERLDRARALVAGLTHREREVLSLVALGMANIEIGRALHLSEGGVKAHISRLLAKLGCGNRVRAALIAQDAGLTGGAGQDPVCPAPT